MYCTVSHLVPCVVLYCGPSLAMCCSVVCPTWCHVLYCCVSHLMPYAVLLCVPPGAMCCTSTVSHLLLVCWSHWLGPGCLPPQPLRFPDLLAQVPGGQPCPLLTTPFPSHVFPDIMQLQLFVGFFLYHHSFPPNKGFSFFFVKFQFTQAGNKMLHRLYSLYNRDRLGFYFLWGNSPPTNTVSICTLYSIYKHYRQSIF